jgi:hypothetical protein
VIVVDTNVVSQLMRPSPSSQVRDWIIAQAPGELCTTAVPVARSATASSGCLKDSLLAATIEVFAAFSHLPDPRRSPGHVQRQRLRGDRDRRDRSVAAEPTRRSHNAPGNLTGNRAKSRLMRGASVTDRTGVVPYRTWPLLADA